MWKVNDNSCAKPFIQFLTKPSWLCIVTTGSVRECFYDFPFRSLDLGCCCFSLSNVWAFLSTAEHTLSKREHALKCHFSIRSGSFWLPWDPVILSSSCLYAYGALFWLRPGQQRRINPLSAKSHPAECVGKVERQKPAWKALLSFWPRVFISISPLACSVI